MRIAIDTLPIVFGGGEVYLINLIKQLAKIDKENEYILIVNSKKKHDFFIPQQNFKQVVRHFPISSRYYRILWEQVVLPFKLKKWGVDVLYSCGNTITLFAPCKTVLSILITPHLFNKDSTKGRGFLKWLLFLVKLSIRRANSLIALSETTKKELSEFFNITEGKVTTVYAGLNKETFKPVNHDNLHFDCRRRYGIDGPYILSVSGIYKHKNYLTLIKAFNILKREKNLNYKLVIVGRIVEHDYYEEIVSTLKSLDLVNDIIFTGHVSVEDLVLLYSKAALYVFPSYNEADGVTPLEAMACGVPVASSNVGSIQESCGEAAMLFNPHDERDMAEAMYNILTVPRLREELVKKGFERVRQFSWEETARKTLRIITETVWQ
jgi:glycosyltransferase involved in cell wall biosynthesis